MAEAGAADFPRGAVDVAVAYHARRMPGWSRRCAAADLSGMKFRDKVAFALRARVAAMDDREAVRRATALFSLPHLAPEGARLIWETADLVWETLGDTSEDLNWYTKRATLVGGLERGAAVLAGRRQLWRAGHGRLHRPADRRRDADREGQGLAAAEAVCRCRWVGCAAMVRRPGRLPADLPGRWAPPAPR